LVEDPAARDVQAGVRGGEVVGFDGQVPSGEDMPGSSSPGTLRRGLRILVDRGPVGDDPGDGGLAGEVGGGLLLTGRGVRIRVHRRSETRHVHRGGEHPEDTDKGEGSFPVHLPALLVHIREQGSLGLFSLGGHW